MDQNGFIWNRRWASSCHDQHRGEVDRRGESRSRCGRWWPNQLRRVRWSHDGQIEEMMPASVTHETLRTLMAYTYVVMIYLISRGVRTSISVIHQKRKIFNLDIYLVLIMDKRLINHKAVQRWHTLPLHGGTRGMLFFLYSSYHGSPAPALDYTAASDCVRHLWIRYNSSGC